MQVTLAGSALITALPSMAGNGEGTSFSKEAWELHDQIPRGPNLLISLPSGDVQPPGKEWSCQQGMQALAHDRVSCTSIPK